MQDLTASIVIYKTPASSLTKTIHSFLEAAPESTLFLIDNSPNDELRCLGDHPKVFTSSIARYQIFKAQFSF